MAINDKNIVSDQFWVNLVAEQIYSVFDRQAKAVETLQKLIMWAFSLFSGTGIVFTFYAKPAEYNPTAIVLFGVAFAVLVLAYFVATQSSFPIARGVRPNEPANIATVHSDTVKFNNRIFRFASFLTFFGFFLIAVGILVQFNPKKEAPKSLPELQFTAKIVEKDTVVFISVTASYMKDSTIFIQIAPCNNVLDPKQKSLHQNHIFTAAYTPKDFSGQVYGSSQWPKLNADCFQVSVSIREKQKNGFVKEVTLTKNLRMVKKQN